MHIQKKTYTSVHIDTFLLAYKHANNIIAGKKPLYVLLRYRYPGTYIPSHVRLGLEAIQQRLLRQH